MSLNDVIITKVDGGLGILAPSTDAISGLIANGVSVVGGVQLSTVYKLQRIEDASALLIDEDYDSSNSVLVYEHIKEFFRINSNGILYLLLVAKSTTFPDLIDPTNTATAKKLVIGANGEINQLAVAYNPTVAVTDDAQLLLALAKAQLFVADEFVKHRPIHVILEGKGFDYTDFTDARTLNSPGVSIMVGQSKTVATVNPTYAAVGTALGAISLAAVNVNIGWVRSFNMYGDNLTDWAISGTSSSSISESALTEVADKGYISFRNHTGIAGIYFTDSPTCTALTSDYSFIELNRTVNKAARIIRATLLPDLNSPIPVDSVTGKIAPATIKSFEAKGQKALDEQMMNNSEASNISFIIDPDQNILSTSNFETQLSITPTGTARKITVKIGFVNPFS